MKDMEQHEVTQVIELVIDQTSSINGDRQDLQNESNTIMSRVKRSTLRLSPILGNFHAGYFRISLSLCGQALLWKVLILNNPRPDAHSLRSLFRAVPPTAFSFLWSLALFALASQSLLYALRCVFHPRKVKAEFLHPVGVNYLYAPWISWLLLIQSSPFISPKSLIYQVLWWVIVVPIVILDVKIYGQWFTKGKRFLSAVANPTSQISVIGNLVAARAAAKMGWTEVAVCMFALGMAHYLVLFITLYQRLAGSDSVPAMLRPVFFLFFAAPSVASLAWSSIAGEFDILSKMLFFLSLFLLLTLISRPKLFRKSMKKFNVAWWAYSFPLTVSALAAIQYAEQVNGVLAHALMITLSGFSFSACLVLLLITAINANVLLPSTLDNDNTPRKSPRKKKERKIIDETPRCESV